MPLDPQAQAYLDQARGRTVVGIGLRLMARAEPLTGVLRHGLAMTMKG